ncbi:MAG TPA: fatty acid desaturase, partial [Phycisphaerae bacterium]|nr:fatty acid desaturase [Phycisphaerae bacterium]
MSAAAAPLSPHDARRLIAAGLEGDIQKLSRLNAGKRWFEILFFVALWGAGAAMTLASGTLPEALARRVVWCAGIGVSAVALNAFVLLLHEGMHGLLFLNRHANRWISAGLGACVLIGYSAYKVMHLRHHRYLGDARDPDDYDNYFRSPRMVWGMHFVRLTVGSYLYILMIPALACRHGRRRERGRVAVEYVLLAGLWGAAFFLVPLHLLAQVWLLPLVLVAAMTGIRGFTQHGIADAHDPFLASRSIHPPRWMAFLLLHENLHLEHHLFPEVPSYHLGQVHKLIAGRLPRALVGRSYLGFIGRFLVLTFSRG